MDNRVDGRRIAIIGAFLGLHLIAAFGVPFPVWGADMLAYYPRWVLLPFALFGGLLVRAVADRGLVTRVTRHLAALAVVGAGGLLPDAHCCNY